MTRESKSNGREIERRYEFEIWKAFDHCGGDPTHLAFVPRNPYRLRFGGLEMVKPSLILQVLSYIYSTMMRPVLVKAINDPEQEWDDVALEVVDRVFGYTGKVK